MVARGEGRREWGEWMLNGSGVLVWQDEMSSGAEC